MNTNDSTSNVNSIDFNQFALENFYLFKSYLFVKIVKKKLPQEKLSENFLILNDIEDKLLLKIIDLCLINNNSIQKNSFIFESNEEVCKSIYDHLLEQYKDLDNDDKEDTGINDISVEFESNILNLLSKIQTFTKLIKNKIEPEKSENVRSWFIKTFYRFSKRSVKFSSLTASPINQISDQKTQNLISLHVFSLTDKMKIEDLMLKILEFTVVRARNIFSCLKKADFSKINYAQNKEQLDDLSSLVEINKVLYDDLCEDKNVGQKTESYRFYTDESESDESVLENPMKPTGRKRKNDNSAIDFYGNVLKKDISVKSLSDHPNTSITKRFRHQSEDDKDWPDSSQNEELYLDDENDYDDKDDEEVSIDNEPNCSKNIMSYSNAAFNHSYKRNKFLSSEKSMNVEKYISMPFDDLLKFHPLTLSVKKLPGIGPTYAQRLQYMDINTFGDLVDLYQIKCKCNDKIFYEELKDMAAMKIDSVTKLVNLIRNYSIQIKSAP